MNRLCVIDVPGLSRDLLQHIPADSALGKWMAAQQVIGLTPSWPAVTCSVQATLTTGKPPAKHGIIANGMANYRSASDQALVDASNFAEYRKAVSFWEQSNQFLDVPRFWQDANGKSKWKTALLFFQHSMPGFSGTLKPAADIVLTPKPDHGPDGKLTSLCWSEPRDLVPSLFKDFGPFPLMNYWGPMASIPSSQWIAKAAAQIWRTQEPTLQLVYVPHLDYDLQRFGPNSPQAIKAVVDLASALEPLLEAVLKDGQLVLLSEYAIEAVDRSIAPNRLLHEARLLTTRETPDGKLVDYEKSEAFVMVDHQIAHVFTKGQAKAVDLLKSAGLELAPAIEHRRAGITMQAPAGAWLDYRWWTDPADAPAFARTVDIHRKPGYDPLELFWDRAPNGVNQNATLIKGSHGRVNDGEALLIGSLKEKRAATVDAVDVAGILAGLID